ncbi:hypothetical protein HID58_080880, partial [Brassica napus]
ALATLPNSSAKVFFTPDSLSSSFAKFFFGPKTLPGVANAGLLLMFSGIFPTPITFRRSSICSGLTRKLPTMSQTAQTSWKYYPEYSQWSSESLCSPTPNLCYLPSR